MIVLDASVVVALVTEPLARRMLASRLSGEPRPHHIPHLLDLEVAHALRRFVAADRLTAAGGAAALRALSILPMRRHPHAALLDRVWALRDNLTAYDAVYLALAERLGATLLTRDARMAAAPGVRAAVEVV